MRLYNERRVVPGTLGMVLLQRQLGAGAWEISSDLPEPTAGECARTLQERGAKVSCDTVVRWARRGKWRERVEQLRAIAGVGCPKDVAATLKVAAQALTPDLLKGVQYRLAARIGGADR